MDHIQNQDNSLDMITIKCITCTIVLQCLEVQLTIIEEHYDRKLV